jgi:DNA (cytosine-5)-methyltransferase 1
MTHGSLFSGIGGFDLAAEWMGWENKFHCEWNEFGQKVLKHYWPNAELFTDITKSDFKKYHGAIDIISGGFPCQPYSAAGKRLGKEDDRHLWPQMLRAIQEIQPKWVVGENVLGLTNWNGGMVFNEVQTDLEAQGYEVQPYVLPSASVNAPHRRDRIWFVAYANNSRADIGMRTERNGEKKNNGRDEQSFSEHWENGSNGIATDTEVEQSERVRLKFGEFGKQEQEQFRGNSSEVGSERNAADTSDEGFQRGKVIGGIGGIGQNGNKFPSGCIPPKWDIFPTQSPICSGNDGIPDGLDGITFPKWRNESIKAYGNAVCPQVVHQIFKAIEQYEQLNTQLKTST